MSARERLRFTGWLAVVGVCATAAIAALGAGPAALAVDAPLRLAISDQVVYGVNRNDASAAIGVWSTELARTLGLKLSPRETWLLPSDEILSAVRSGSLDLVCLTVIEYRRVRAHVDASRFLCDGGDELWLLVREGGDIANLAGLQGRSVIVHDSPFTILADAWLAVSMAKEGLGAPAKAFGRLTRNPRIAQVVLPVFFGQADACVAPRRGVETMFELNPQLAKKLKVLAASPRLITAFLACRKDIAGAERDRMFHKISLAKSIPAAQQVFTLFQSKGFSVVEGEELRAPMNLLDAWERSGGGKR